MRTRKISTVLAAVVALGLTVPALATPAAVAGTTASYPGPKIKPALLLEPGASDPLGYALRNPTAFVWRTSDPSVAKVDFRGNVKAVAVGDASVTVRKDGHLIATVPVTVARNVERVGRSFLTGVLWAADKKTTDDAHYRTIADGGIDVIQNQSLKTDPYLGTGDRDSNLLMAELAHKYGMQVLVADNRIPWNGNSKPPQTKKQIENFIQTYRHVPGVGGMNFVDEPAQASDFASVYLAMKSIAPEWYGYVNFCPLGYCGATVENVKAWLEASGGVQKNIYGTDYLMYDYYVLNKKNTDMKGLLGNIDAIRQLGLTYNIKTGAYVNLMEHAGYRRTTPTDLTWQANVQAAYGYKSLWYFTWQTPISKDYTFGPAAVDVNGVKTDMFNPVKKTNAAMHALGPVLMRLDAREVHLSGNLYGRSGVPQNFFVHPKSKGNLVLSRMVDRKNGSEYLFVVNNAELGDGSVPPAEQNVTLDFAKSISGLHEVSRIDGTESPVALTHHQLRRHLDSAEGVLYRIDR